MSTVYTKNQSRNNKMMKKMENGEKRPPTPPPPPNSLEHIKVREVIEKMCLDVTNTKDNLMLAKIAQSHHANKSRSDSFLYKVGNLVMLSTLNRCWEYKNSAEKHVAKFMPQFDGPYLVNNTHNEASTVTLEIPSALNIFPTFHSSLVKPFHENNNSKFPSCTLEKPGAIVVDGHEEFFISKLQFLT